MLQAILSVGGGLLYSTGSLVGVGDFAHLRKLVIVRILSSQQKHFGCCYLQLRCGTGAMALSHLGCFRKMSHSLKTEDENVMLRDNTRSAVWWGGGGGAAVTNGMDIGVDTCIDGHLSVYTLLPIRSTSAAAFVTGIHVWRAFQQRENLWR